MHLNLSSLNQRAVHSLTSPFGICAIRKRYKTESLHAIKTKTRFMQSRQKQDSCNQRQKQDPCSQTDRCKAGDAIEGMHKVKNNFCCSSSSLGLASFLRLTQDQSN